MTYNQDLFMQRLRTLRKQKNLSQEQLAKAVNVSRGAVGNWELGIRTPELNTVSLLSQVFDCSISYILGLTDVKEDIQASPVFDAMFNSTVPMFIIMCNELNLCSFAWVNDAALEELGYQREEFLRLNPKQVCEQICFENIEEKTAILDKENTLETGWISITKSGERILSKQIYHKLSTSTQTYYLVVSHFISSL